MSRQLVITYYADRDMLGLVSDEDYEAFNFNGGEEEDRTPDLRIANATLSQLSYPPTEAASLANRALAPIWPRRDSPARFVELRTCIAGKARTR